jgi:prepilin-type N-terminal cleavage/methylation domain-containing protein
MNKKIFNQKGFTLAELMVATILVSLLTYGFALAMLQFVIAYQENRDLILLQQDMMYVMNHVRQGVVIDGIHNNEYNDFPLLGLQTAQRISINHTNNALTMSPVRGSDALTRMWSRIRHEQHTGRVLFDYQFHSQSKFGEVIFPSTRTRHGQESRFRMTNLQFTDITPGPRQLQPQLVMVKMEGQVRFRERGRINPRRLMTVEQDQQMNIRRIEFETVVYVGNADKFD